MQTATREFLKIDPADSASWLTDLNSTLAQHVQYLEKHSAVMENLTQAIRDLETTIKKINVLDTTENSLQLKDVLITFVRYNINPRFYQNTDGTMPHNTVQIGYNRPIRGYLPGASKSTWCIAPSFKRMVDQTLPRIYNQPVSRVVKAGSRLSPDIDW
jgi:hypothetical protein